MTTLADELAALEAAGLRRDLQRPAGIDLTSNDYLGLASDPVVRKALADALARGLPHGSTGSRLLSGNHPAFEALEVRFAAWQGAPRALFFSSGFAANGGLLSAVVKAGDRVISDRLNHASLIDGLRLTRAERVVVPHLDLDAITGALKTSTAPTWVVVESVYSMDGDRAPLEPLLEVCARYGARLIVDEAHGTGLFGERGQGLTAGLRPHPALFATVHPCGKALGASGALVCGDATLIDYLINRSRAFIYSTAPSPLVAVAVEAALSLVEAHPERRALPLQHGARLRRQLPAELDTGASSTHVVPVIVGSVTAAQSLAHFLGEAGWGVRCIRPPTVPEGTSRVRLVMRAGLSTDEVDRLAVDLNRWVAQVTPIRRTAP